MDERIALRVQTPCRSQTHPETELNSMDLCFK
jgi:hypothetical protein